MLPMCTERLKELNEKMLDWICEHIKENEDLFYALHNRIGFAPSELDPEIDARVYKHYHALPAIDRFNLKIQAEYAEFLSLWRGMNTDELINQAEKIGIINRLMVRTCEPRNRKPVSWTCSNPLCRAKTYINDDVLELRIQERMNLIIENPDLLVKDDDYTMDKGETSKDTADLRRLCDTNNYSEEELLGKILNMTVERYDTLKHTPIEITTAVGMAYENATQQEQFNAELFLQTVEKIILSEDGNITLKLKNNIEI